MTWLCDRTECDPDEGCEWYCFECDRPGCRCSCGVLEKVKRTYDADELGIDQEDD